MATAGSWLVGLDLARARVYPFNGSGARGRGEEVFLVVPRVATRAPWEGLEAPYFELIVYTALNLK